MGCASCAEKRRALMDAVRAGQVGEAVRHGREGLAMVAGLRPKPEMDAEALNAAVRKAAARAGTDG